MSNKQSNKQTNKQTNKQSNKQSNKNQEEEHDMLDDISHALLRPDMYIGTIEASMLPMWIYDEETTKHYGKVKIGKKIYEIELNDWEFKDLN